MNHSDSWYLTVRLFVRLNYKGVVKRESKRVIKGTSYPTRNRTHPPRKNANREPFCSLLPFFLDGWELDWEGYDSPVSSLNGKYFIFRMLLTENEYHHRLCIDTLCTASFEQAALFYHFQCTTKLCAISRWKGYYELDIDECSAKGLSMLKRTINSPWGFILWWKEGIWKNKA